jgi:GT2 family glycosyltransferase
VEWHHRPQRRGVAEQRHFLLQRARAPAVLYLDDDVFMESWVIAALMDTLAREQCGFVGAFPAGMSFRDDVRPAQQAIEFWRGRVQPEVVEPGSPAWERYQLHRAANLFHVGLSLTGVAPRPYKVAWVGACVLYDRLKLLDVGGFGFWEQLPACHSGEDALVQNLLMRRYGGCGIVP